MTGKSPAERSLDRKKREAAALKANLKRRKEQAKTQADAEPADTMENN